MTDTTPSPVAASVATDAAPTATPTNTTTENTVNTLPPQELLDKMVEYSRTDMLKQFKKHKAVTDRVKGPVKARFLGSEGELAAVLASNTTDPCMPLIRRVDGDFSLWLWLPGLENFDIFAYLFDGNGTYKNVGARLHSKMIIGR